MQKKFTVIDHSHAFDALYNEYVAPSPKMRKRNSGDTTAASQATPIAAPPTSDKQRGKQKAHTTWITPRRKAQH
eukprot:3650863-Pleurochrysis_carterae.AAC.2